MSTPDVEKIISDAVSALPYCFEGYEARFGNFHREGVDDIVRKAVLKSFELAGSRFLANQESDDYQVGRVLLQCCSRLGMANLADVSECRTMDVAESLEARLKLLDEEADASAAVDTQVIDWIDGFVRGDDSIEICEEDGGLILIARSHRVQNAYVGKDVREAAGEAISNERKAGLK